MIYRLFQDGTLHSENNSPPMLLSESALSLSLVSFLHMLLENTRAAVLGKLSVVFEDLFAVSLLSRRLLVEKPFLTLFITLCPRILEVRNPCLLLTYSHLATHL